MIPDSFGRPKPFKLLPFPFGRDNKKFKNGHSGWDVKVLDSFVQQEVVPPDASQKASSRSNLGLLSWVCVWLVLPFPGLCDITTLSLLWTRMGGGQRGQIFGESLGLRLQINSISFPFSCPYFFYVPGRNRAITGAMASSFFPLEKQ